MASIPQTGILEELASLIMHEYLKFCEQQPNRRSADDQQAIETNEAEDAAAKKVPQRSSALSIIRLTDQYDRSISDKNALIPVIGRDNSISCIVRCSRADYGSIACLNRSFRSLMSNIYKLRRQIGIIEHWVYFSCQPLEWEAFDPIRRRWIRVPKMERNDCFMHSDKESLAVGTEILAFGRDFASHAIYRYSLLTNAWTTAQPMNQERYAFASASFGEKAIVAGGCDSKGNILSSAELYDSWTQTWRRIEGMNKPRKMCSGAFMDGKFYVIDAFGGEEYDMETKTWREMPELSPVRSDGENDAPEAPPLIAVVNNDLYAAHYSDMMVRKFVKSTGTWINIGSLPERVSSMFGWGLAFRGCGDRLIVVGGPRSCGIGFIEINSWVPNEGPVQWDLLGRKLSSSFVYNCAVMGC